MAKRKNSFISMVVYLLAVLLIALAAGFVVVSFKNTDGTETTADKIAVSYDGVAINAKKELLLPTETECRFDCSTDYVVKIKPCIAYGNDFSYTIDGLEYGYGSINDLTAAFDIEQGEGYFTLTIPPDLSMQTIITRIFINKNAWSPDIEFTTQAAYFTLYVYKADETEYVSVNIFLSIPKTGDVSLDKGGIVF